MTTKKLTDFAIKAIKPDPTKRQEIPAGLGLYLIVQPSGSKGWALRYRRPHDGRPQKATLGSLFEGDVKDAPKPVLGGLLTLAGARALAAAEMQKIKETGHDPAAAKRKAQEEHDRKQANTFRNVATRYMMLEAGMKLDDDGNPIKFDRNKLRTGPERWQMLERSILPTLGSMPVSDIRKSDVIKMLDKLATGDLKDQHKRPIRGGEVAADRALAVVRKIFRWHATRSDDFRSPIVPGLNRVKASDQARARVLTDDELKTIWKTASGLQGPFPAFVLFSLLTGARRGEVAGMRWSEIDAAGDWELPAERNKVKVPLLRSLSKAARDLLATRPRINGQEFVFSSDGRGRIRGFGKLKEKFDAALFVEWKKLHPEAKEFPPYVIHDFRRSARTWMSKAGVSSDHAERVLGHVIGGVRGVYDRHAYYDEKKLALEKLAWQVAVIVDPPPSNVHPFKSVAGDQ
jgi:integrase